ncbi:MAG: hypothetical protein FJ077_13270 [Cyanobacteria bacterium K_DeepCast_35m_m2_023]|nr:hypothetical protein [Cyanobacteria bacterium K_DeepCast_35m_m2_023]
MAWLLPWLLTVMLSLVLLVCPAGAAAAEPLQQDQYLCDGDPLQAQVFAGAVDAPGIPPGAYVVLRWRGLSLQLPRTNNAGAPSYTDGRWWWQAADPAHPAFKQRRGSTLTYSCQWQSGP